MTNKDLWTISRFSLYLYLSAGSSCLCVF
uniref:Uncharacterized protein n=1 Tax=Arundo donax TaxID=35708 RepID=A0A0A9FEU2_ARUDO